MKNRRENTKFILVHATRLACIDLEVKRLWLQFCLASGYLPAWVCTSIRQLRYVIICAVNNLLVLCCDVSFSKRSERSRCRLEVRRASDTCNNWSRNVTSCGRTDDRCVKKSASLETTASTKSANLYLLLTDILYSCTNLDAYHIGSYIYVYL